MHAAPAPKYLFNPTEKPSLPLHRAPLVEASNASLAGYGFLVDDPAECPIEIVRWPASGWRRVDEDSGNEGGTTEGTFESFWCGDVLRGRNAAVGGDYVLGWSRDPQSASAERQTVAREQVLLWHFNFHPDGGQLFFPLDKSPFVVPLALPGDDLGPEQIVGFWCDGGRGLYIHPSVWHEGVCAVADRQRFFDRQGAVHARVSADLGAEFGCYVAVPLVR